LAFRDGLVHGEYVPSFDDIPDRETSNGDMLFMHIGIHRSISRDLGREVLRGVDRSFNDRSVGLADANILDLERLTVTFVLKRRDAFGGNGRLRLNSFADGVVDAATAIGLEADFNRYVFDDDGFLRIFGGVRFGGGRLQVAVRLRGRCSRFGCG
jgi:hypothetical protein